MSASSSPTSYPKNKIKILMLENIHQDAVKAFEDEGFSVETHKKSLPSVELEKKLPEYHAICIRSKTKLTDELLAVGSKLLAIGCFCIGTNQVDLDAAEQLGIPVFNSPFSNSRSVAELTLSNIIQLARQIPDRNREMHAGKWNKVSAGCHEVRGKTLGIIGYGHIGSQLSVLAEALGMRVIFYDVIDAMPLGNSRAVGSQDELLAEADYVTLHVPDLPTTRGLIGADEIAKMKPGSMLINASRGSVVDTGAAAAALKSGHLGGGAFDVYPVEPAANGDFWTDFKDCPNTILTPHIGGSTEEAQLAIGHEVASKIISLINCGSTMTAVNFPEVDAPRKPNSHRIVNSHRNVPGVVKSINHILDSTPDINILGMTLKTTDSVGYLHVDVDREASEDVKKAVADLPTSIKTRILF